MNDFTKDELKIIRNLINNLDEKMLTWSEEVILVQSKIQWMIDNYCEHPEKMYSRKTGKPVCPICHTYFGDNGDDIEARLKGYVSE